MVVYNFKKITPVPDAKDFVDIVLTRTQRKTPTVVHKGYEISRIRRFYMRKVKFTQDTFHEKLTVVLDGFPRLDDIHPFYADLINILYDKDHYKLALGQLAMVRQLVDKISKDYLRLLKYGDSLYRCKQLKRAALGRMCTIMRKQGPSLQYLEQVRQHLARLPSIEPNTRTLILCGYPNVGKSSFMNKVTRADVEVQPYPFTTKSLFVGHTDYKYLQWQVIDTPGILDKALEERNTIEMQSITAMAHLRACIMYFMDLSEVCGYSIAQQVKLFNEIKPLFVNKPVMLVINKIDKRRLEDLTPQERKAIDEMTGNGAIPIVCMSTYTDEGVDGVKSNACDMLLQYRVEAKLRNKKVTDVLSRVHLALPKPRDGKAREPFIPETVATAKAGSDSAMESSRRTALEQEREGGGAGRFVFDAKKQYQLADPEWNYDVVPEIMDGMNVADFVDEDILAKLDELEAEEGLLEAEDESRERVPELSEDLVGKMHAIRKHRVLKVGDRQMKKRSSLRRAAGMLDADEAADRLLEKGMDEEVVERFRSRSRSVAEESQSRKRCRSHVDDAVSAEQAEVETRMDRERTRSRSRSVVPGEGFRNVKQKVSAEKNFNREQKSRTHDARKGDADRHIYDLMPKHLFSGKRKQGSTDRR